MCPFLVHDLLAIVSIFLQLERLEENQKGLTGLTCDFGVLSQLDCFHHSNNEAIVLRDFQRIFWRVLAQIR